VDSSDEEFGDDDTGSTKDPSYEPDFDNWF
jgi:hypothetical protein